MRLSVWLRKNKDLLVQAWAQHASTLPAGHGLNQQQLEDSSADLLVLIADELETIRLSGAKQDDSRHRCDVPSLSLVARNHVLRSALPLTRWRQSTERSGPQSCRAG